MRITSVNYIKAKNIFNCEYYKELIKVLCTSVKYMHDEKKIAKNCLINNKKKHNWDEYRN